MKKSILILFGILSILTSCSVSKNTSSNYSTVESDDIEVIVTYLQPGEVDTSSSLKHLYEDDSTYYNKYLIYDSRYDWESIVSYYSDYDFWYYHDSSEVKIIDTLKYHVLFRDLK